MTDAVDTVSIDLCARMERDGNPLAAATAFDVVWRQHHRAVLRYLASRIGLDAAEDVVAETYLAAHGARLGYRSAKSPNGPLPWLLGIATKQVARHRELERRWLTRTNGMLVETPTADATDAIVLRGPLADALEQLQHSYRDAFLLFVLADLDYAQVGAALGVPIGTVRSRISRARTALAAALEEER
jgi:RNA polymerase sigma-70 factor (ECF subfamily)